MRYILTFILALAAAISLQSCIEDGYVTDSSAQPEFSVDTLRMGSFFTEDVTPTFSFVVYNRHDKILNISSISLRNGSSGIFRLNVDGITGKTFSNVEIRPNDSIFVFVEARIPALDSPDGIVYKEPLDFVTNGVSSSVVLKVEGRDVERHTGLVITEDTRWEADMPRRIYDSLVVAEGAKLTLAAGLNLYFHDKASFKVRGTLVAEGTPGADVTMTGDRTDNVVGQIPFDLMSGQWGGLYFYPTSRANRLTNTVVKNTVWGVVVDSIPSGPEPGLYMLNCRLRNSMGYSLQSSYSDVTAIGCEMAEASYGVVYLRGGRLCFNHCTVANYYLFTAPVYAMVEFSHFSEATRRADDQPLMSADFANCVFYGLAPDFSVGDFTGADVYVRRCLLKSAGSNDDNFIDCLWNVDPLYYTVRDSYIFDYRFKPGSPAIGAATPQLTLPEAATDYYGLPRGDTPDLGAYVAGQN